MNNRALTLSLVMAVIAIFFVQSYVSSIEEEAKKKFGTEVLVVVAKKDIREMDTITDDVMELKLVPKNFQEPGAISIDKGGREESAGNKNASKVFQSLAGSVALVPIKRGEQITYSKLSEPSMRTGLSSQISPGRRAIAVPVNDVSGVGKLVKPGDRVDLIAVVDAGGGKEFKVAKTILQDVVVLSTGRSVTNNVPRVVEADPTGGKDRVRSLAEDFSFSTVTLEVEPAQAQMLALVLANGDNALTLALRNNDDTERVNYPVTILGDVLGADLVKAKPPAQGGIRR